jgi:hypothetical protein
MIPDHCAANRCITTGISAVSRPLMASHESATESVSSTLGSLPPEHKAHESKPGGLMDRGSAESLSSPGKSD